MYTGLGFLIGFPVVIAIIVLSLLYLRCALVILGLGLACTIWLLASYWLNIGLFLYDVVSLYLFIPLAGLCTVAGVVGVLRHGLARLVAR